VLQRLSIVPFMLLCSIAACGGGGGSNLCDVNEDCDSGFCKANGTCGPAADDAGGDDGAPSDTPSGVCSPNADGMVTQAELPLVAGKMARFRVALDTTFDTAGTTSGGMRTWDLSGSLSGDTDTPITLDGPTGAYWAADFPTATYATPLSQDPANGNLIGIFRVDANAVTLLGIVSPTAGQFGTNVSYDPPATILKLPITSGAQWTSTSKVTGTINGGFVNYDEKYESNVDQTGTMKTPYGTFPVLRVATDLTQLQLGVAYNSNRSFSWIAECFGSVANVTSKANESSSEFSDPAEVKRLIP
jgi:hypothetical protein